MGKFRIISLEDDSPQPALDVPDNDPKPAEAEPPAPTPEVPDNTPADTSDLNVLQLEKNTLDEENKKLKEEEETRQENLGNAVNDLELLNVAAESFANCLHGNGSKTEFALASEVYSRVRSSLGFASNRSQISLEQYDQADGKKIAMESIKDTMNQVFTAIIKVIIDAVKWLNKTFRSIFSQANNLIRSNKTMTTMFLKHRSVFDPKSDKSKKTATIDFKRYVDLPTHKLNLTYMGNQPPDTFITTYDIRGRPNGKESTTYPDMFDRIKELVSLHRLFRKNISAEMLSSLEEAKKALLDDDPNAQVSFFDPLDFHLDNSQDVMHVEGIDCPDGSRMFAKSGYLGNVIYVSQYNSESWANPVNSGLNDWGRWRMKLVRADTEMRDGWMSYLPTADVVKTFHSIADLSHELLDCEKTIDCVEHVLTSLESQLSTFKSTFTEGDFSSNGQTPLTEQEKLERAKMFSKIASAVNGVISSTNTYLFQVTNYAITTQTSWLYYLNAIMRYEESLMK